MNQLCLCAMRESVCVEMNYGCGGNSAKIQLLNVDSAIMLMLKSSLNDFLWKAVFLTNLPLP